MNLTNGQKPLIQYGTHNCTAVTDSSLGNASNLSVMLCWLTISINKMCYAQLSTITKRIFPDLMSIYFFYYEISFPFSQDFTKDIVISILTFGDIGNYKLRIFININ